MRSFWASGCLAAIALCLSGCATVEYLAQAGCGQVNLGLRSRPIERVLSDEHASPRLRALLSEVPTIKRFAEQQGLKPTNNYKAYADLWRAAAVWVVSASDPLAFTPRTWAFPVVGSVPYLGFFDRSEARDFADSLRAQGFDVDMRGSEAYSTLGWFEDPILSTMISDGDDALGDLANVVLHESVHATYYVRGQTALNESVAEFLGDRLAIRFLGARVGDDSNELLAYVDAQREHTRRGKVLHAAYEKLAALYASDLPRAEKLAEKAHVVDRLRSDLGFNRRINNATLAGHEVYNSGKVELEQLFDACGNNAARMLDALRDLPPSSFSTPHDKDIHKMLAPLLSVPCPPSKSNESTRAR